MNLQQQIFSLRSAIISAKRSIPHQQDIQREEEREGFVESVNEVVRMPQGQKIKKMRKLLNAGKEVMESEERDYFIDLAHQKVKKRPAFSSELRTMLRNRSKARK